MPCKDRDQAREYNKKWYRANVKKRITTIRDWKLRQKALLLEVKSKAGCESCRTHDPSKLRFYHRDLVQAAFDLNQAHDDGVSKARILNEIKICGVWCRRCFSTAHPDDPRASGRMSGRTFQARNRELVKALGMSYGKACNRLRRMVLFNVVRLAN